MRKYIVAVLLIVTVCGLSAQDVSIVHHPFYRDGINPGSFTQANDFNLFLLHSTQYMGYDVQPNYQIIDVGFYSGGNKIGATLNNDGMGVERKMDFKIRYAKQFDLSNNSFFSLGVNAGAVTARYDADKMVFENEDDPLQYIDHSHTKFDFDFGTEFQFSKLTAGLSVNHLNTFLTEERDEALLPHVFGYAQYGINTNGSISLYPNVLSRYWNKTFWLESTLLVFYKDLVWIGPAYSSNHDLTLSTGLSFKNFRLGYAFRANMDSDILAAWGANSHELMLNIAFNREKVNIRTPRFID